MIGIANAIGIGWGLYVIAIPNDARFFKKYYPRQWGPIGRIGGKITFNKQQEYTQEQLFEIIRAYYIRVRQIFWLSLVTILGLFVILFLATLFEVTLP